MVSRWIQWIALLTPLIVLISQMTAQEKQEEVLFNGHDLKGWKGDPRIWSVRDGMLIGSTEGIEPIQANTFLICQAKDLGDFRLDVECRIQGGNSGIQYRSQVVDAERWIVSGYQADFDSEQTYSGILYEERGRGILSLRGEKTVIDENDQRTKSRFASDEELRSKIHGGQWNTYTVEARGDRLRHWLNGQLMSETVDRARDHRRGSGVLALQVHQGPPMMVFFRNFKLQRFEPGDPGETPATKRPRQLERALPPQSLRVAPGFHVELVCEVPRDEQGSWVAMTVDPRGRLIASDQYGRLYRVTPPPPDTGPEASKVEPLAVQLGMAQGLTFVNDRLYAVVNGEGVEGNGSGLYCLEDRDHNDTFEIVRRLRAIEGEGEHGPHAVVPGPDGKSLFVVAGNHTTLTRVDESRVPRHWSEDLLLPRLWDANGHAVGIVAPGGWICRTDLEGRTWELVSIGYRNAYDLAFNTDGELFTYDSDMEWDVGAPWYRPTRICHVTPGSEFGWRSGSGKWPTHSPDSLPPAIELGTGSPTGITFGYGTAFPKEYQQCLFACDWSFGRIDAVQLVPEGSTYRGEAKEFLTGMPLPLTDVVVNRHDGAMYFSVGGRKTKSAVYRITYRGPDSDTDQEKASEPSEPSTARDLRAVRHLAERRCGHVDPATIDLVWPLLDHQDRFIRFAAHTALEWQPVEQWEPRALKETRPWPALEAIVALARCSSPANHGRAQAMLQSLARLDWDQLNYDQRLAWLRATELVLIRTQTTDAATRDSLANRLKALFPQPDAEIQLRLSNLLAFLGVPEVVGPLLATMESGATQEERIAAAYALRVDLPKASLSQQRRYFQWFPDARHIRGGESLRGFLAMIRDEAAKGLPADRRKELAEIIAAPMELDNTSPESPPGPVVRHYSVEEVVSAASDPSNLGDFTAARAAFAKAQCFKCHRVGLEGGATGPDLTTATRRFSIPYLAESIVDPNREISDRFQRTRFLLQDGRTVVGRVANMSDDEIYVVTDLLKPGDFSVLKRDEIDEAAPIHSSEMPEGLLDSLSSDEIRALFAFLRSSS